MRNQILVVRAKLKWRRDGDALAANLTLQGTLGLTARSWVLDMIGMTTLARDDGCGVESKGSASRITMADEGPIRTQYNGSLLGLGIGAGVATRPHLFSGRLCRGTVENRGKKDWLCVTYTHLGFLRS